MTPALLVLWLCVVLQTCRIVDSSSTSAPWQSGSGTNVREEQSYGDLPPTVFAPGGRLYSVERTVAAASSADDASSNLVVAISCKDGLVVVSTSNHSPHLDVNDDREDEDSSTMVPLWITNERQHRPPVARVASNVWMVTGGNAVDSRILRYKISRIAEAMQEANDGGQPLAAAPLSCTSLARRASDHLQLPTQTIGKAGRILAVRSDTHVFQ